MYKNLIFLFCNLLSINILKKPQKPLLPAKFLIGHHDGAGLFSLFFGAVNNISWCQTNNRIPVIYWGKFCNYYTPEGYNDSKNVWEYYFEPVSYLSYDPAVDRLYHLHNRFNPPYGNIELKSGQMPTAAQRTHIKEIIDRYIKLKPQVQSKVNQFYKEHMFNKKTIGMHIRRTDKYKEIMPVPLEWFWQYGSTFTAQGYQLLIATDDQTVLDKAKQLFARKVIYYDCFRSKDGKPIHLRYSPAKKGEDVLVEAILLSRCDKFVHTHSNVAAGVLCFNPYLDNIFLSTR